MLDACSITSHQLPGLYEWSKIGAATFVVGDNVTLLSKTSRDASSHSPKTYGELGSNRFDTLTIPRMFQCLHLMRYKIFTPSTGVFLSVCDTFLFDESTVFTVDAIALTVLICTEVHVDIKVLNPGS